LIDCSDFLDGEDILVGENAEEFKQGAREIEVWIVKSF
jgi:hypothetical protein